MRGSRLLFVLVSQLIACAGSEMATSSLGSALPSQPGGPAGAAPAVPTNSVLLAFLTSGHGDTALVGGVENLVQAFEVYAPCHAKFATMPAVAVRPVIGCPLPYKVWAVELLVAPATVLNTGADTATLTVTVYSDNVYVYQQQQTLGPGWRTTVSFGALQLGYICSDGGPSMPVSVSMRVSGTGITLMRGTNEPATLSRPQVDDYPKVWGSAVVLVPLDAESGVCGA